MDTRAKTATKGATMLHVGAAQTTVSDATAFARRYVTEPGWAYPAYDAYPGGPSTDVSEQDLFGFVLLNVNQRPLQSYYSLMNELEQINTKLNDPRLVGDLESANDDTLDAIADLYGLVSGHAIPYVGLTKLSKVLHRKRPGLLPLFDRNIERCYQHIEPARIPADRRRSARGFVALWVREVQKDLQHNLDGWRSIASLATQPPITALRALDIVGWHLGRP